MIRSIMQYFVKVYLIAVKINLEKKSSRSVATKIRHFVFFNKYFKKNVFDT